MCGINLIIDKKGVVDTVPIIKMMSATDHRGPDNASFVEINRSSRVFLSHTRLKVIDLSQAANQPMTSPCGRYYLIFNGEIYNFYQLRNKLLDQGVTFITHSDTEVLLHHLIMNGKSSIQLLEGMFVFIFYDRESEEVVMARDRNGIKPLFYYHDANFFVASSETKPILSSGLAQKILNDNQVYHFLKYKFSKSPETFFKNIFSLMPGTVLSIDKDFGCEITYSSSSLKRDAQNNIENDELVAKTEELLCDAISTQLNADVPVGLFLSGGVDSTLILALLQKTSNYMIPSFSIVHNKKEGSFGTEDYKYAKLAASSYGSYLQEIEVGVDDLKDFDEFIENLDQPIGDSGAFLTHKLSRETKKKVGVALSGAGADEVFGGYNRHIAFMWYLKNHKLLTLLSPILKPAEKFLPAGFNHPLRKQTQLLKKFLRNYDPDPETTYKNFTSLAITPSASNGSYDFKYQTEKEQYINAALAFDRDTYLVSDVLALTDLTSMRHALEVRVPYLDHNLLNFVDSIPGERILSKGRKWILNEILKRNGGEVFTKRRKEGMGLPFGNWIKKDPSNPAFRYLVSNNLYLKEILTNNEIQLLLSNHLKGKADNTLELWTILVLEAWLQKTFGEKALSHL